MKNIIRILLIVLLCIVLYILYKRYIPLSIKEKVELQQYKKQEKIQKQKDEELRSIVSEKIILAELQSTDKIVLLESKAVYENVFTKVASFSFINNKLHIRIPYVVQIQYDASNISVTSMEGTNVNVDANVRGKFYIIVILNAEGIEYAKDSNAWYKADFYCDELKDILLLVQSELENKYANDEDVYYRCCDALIEYIETVSGKYGVTAKINLKE